MNRGWRERRGGHVNWRESPGPEQVSLVHPQSMEGQRGGTRGQGPQGPAPPGHSGDAGFAGRVVESHGRSGAESPEI